MPEIVHAPAPVFTPAETLKTAVRWARAQGWTVRLGSFGVVPVSTHGDRRWERDELERDPGTSPLGCLILLAQPPAIDPERAAAQTLGVDLSFVVGLLDGMAMEPKDSAWMASLKRLNYLKGYETGASFRIWFKSTGNES